MTVAPSSDTNGQSIYPAPHFEGSEKRVEVTLTLTLTLTR